MIFLIKIIVRYGWLGVKEYVKLKLGKIDYLRFKDNSFETIYLKGYDRPILLRSQTTDFSTFKQIFHNQEYNISFDFNPDVIIDAGANIGLASIYFAKRYPEAHIYAIEPETTNYNRLLDTINSYKNIMPFKAALHHTTNEEMEIVDQGVGHWGFATKIKEDISNNSLETIKTVSISSLIDKYELQKIDILKMDIEGAEADVFMKNYNDWLPKVKCLIIEFHERFRPGSEEKIKTLITYFKFSGYQKGENWIFINHDFF